MKEDILQKYQDKFQQILFHEVDALFPENKSKERENALLLITILGVKFGYLIKELTKEQDGTSQTKKIS